MQVYAIIAALLLGFAGGWATKGWQRDSRELVEVRQEQKAKTIRLEASATVDYKHTQELEALRRENSRLTADLAAGSVRLSVPVSVPSDCAATGVDDGNHKSEPDRIVIADIPPEKSRQAVEVTSRGDEFIARHRGLVEWVRVNCSSHP